MMNIQKLSIVIIGSVCLLGAGQAQAINQVHTVPLSANDIVDRSNFPFEPVWTMESNETTSLSYEKQYLIPSLKRDQGVQEKHLPFIKIKLADRAL